MNALKNTYESLPANKQEATRQKIMDACEWSTSTFYLKCKHPDTISKLEKQAIAKILKLRTEQLFGDLQTAMQKPFARQTR